MYHYENHKFKIFTEHGQRNFLMVRDNVEKLLSAAGAVTMEKAISVITGDIWDMMANVDRLVEIGELREIDQFGDRAAQHRIFVKRGR